MCGPGAEAVVPDQGSDQPRASDDQQEAGCAPRRQANPVHGGLRVDHHSADGSRPRGQLLVGHALRTRCAIRRSLYRSGGERAAIARQPMPRTCPVHGRRAAGDAAASRTTTQACRLGACGRHASRDPFRRPGASHRANALATFRLFYSRLRRLDRVLSQRGPRAAGEAIRWASAGPGICDRVCCERSTPVYAGVLR